MKKIILLFTMLFCITGCNVEYKLDINNDFEFKEIITISGSVSDFGSNTDEDFINEYVDSFIIDFPNYKFKEKNIENGKYNFIIEGSHSGKEQYMNSELLKLIYKNSNIYTNSTGSVVFDLRPYDCTENDACTPIMVEDMDIIISSDKNIVSSNADQIKAGGTKYIWHITKSNFKDIYFELTDERIYNKNYIYIGVGIIVLFVLGVLFYKKFKKNNEI